MLIDTHAHVIPARFPPAEGSTHGSREWPQMERTESDGARVLVTDRLRFAATETFYDPEARLRAMVADGVDAEVISPMPPLLKYGLAPTRGLALCRHVNEFVAEFSASAPDRFFGLGTVPLQDPDLAADGLSEIKEIGLHGIEIGSNIAGRSLGEDRFLGFFQEAERLEIPIFVHALDPTVGDRLPAHAVGTFGFATEIALAAASIITGGTAEKCPSLRLAFSHGAGGFPLTLTRAQYFWGRTWNEEPRPEPSPDRSGRAPHSPADYARRYFYDALVFDRRALKYVIDMIGPSQLVLGTDFPAMPRERPAARTLRSMMLPSAVLEDITWNNCFRFLGIDPRARTWT